MQPSHTAWHRSLVNAFLPSSFWSSVHQATTGGRWPPATAAEARRLVERCSWHGLLPLLFAQPDLPPAVERARDEARGWQRILDVRARLFQDAIVAVCAALGDEPALLLKGADYAQRLYPDRSLRPMQDVDVLVAADRIDVACRRLMDAGLVRQPAVGAARDPLHHERVFFRGRVIVEVHQFFVQRARHRIDYDAIWRRRVPLEVGGRQVARLDDVDALAYHALSMAIDQFHVRFIRYVDLWLLLRQGDWIALAAAERARDWQAARALYGALSLGCRLFPELRTGDVGEAMARALTASTRRFVDRWVLPPLRELRRTREPHRLVQLWRKACLMDAARRRVAFALSHAAATWRSRRSGGPGEGSLPREGASAIRIPPLRRLAALARPEAGLLGLGAVFLALSAGATLLYPQAIRLVIDGALGRGGSRLLGSGPGLLDRAAVALAALALVQGAAGALRYALFALAGERVVARLRRDLHRHLLDQEIAFFDERRTGELTSRLAADTGTLQNAVTANVSMALRNLAVVAGGIGFLLYTSPALTLLMLSVAPAVAAGAAVYARRIRGLSRESQDALAAAGAIAEESLSGIRTVRAFDAEAREADRYGGSIQRAYATARRRILAGGAFMAGAMAGAYAAVALVLWYGARLVARDALSAGALTSFLVYALFVTMSLWVLADLWADLHRALGAAERVFELQDRVPALPARGGAAPPRVEGHLSLEAVRFSYPARPGSPVLRGLDLDIRAGEIVALVGPSGAGKSTVAALVARLYDPDGGRIRLDGRDLRELDPHWLRQRIGAVSQEPILFSTTVADNIRYGRPQATDAEVEAAARAANAHEFIAAFPGGYATPVGERGVQLSGGQKQRVAIARALLKDPRILLLDEATSALDAESERLVREALERLMAGRTALIIAHRLSTVMGAHRVVVLEAGRVVQHGSHASLLREDGPYRRLVERQFAAA